MNATAFLSDAEALLVDALREQSQPFISLVAEEGSAIVGHICFTPVTGDDQMSHVRIAGLTPMAVAPQGQRRGIGSQLVRRGLEECRGEGFEAVVVLGHPEYYPRFGFQPASRFGLRCEYDVPDEVFMALELREGSLDGVNGVVRYHPAFAAV